MAKIDLPTREQILASAGIPASDVPLEEKETITPVITGKVIKKKPSLSKRFVSAFIGKDIQDVKQHMVTNVVVPTIKWALCEMARSIPEFLFYGRNNVRPPYSGIGSSLYSGPSYPYYNYSRVSVIDQSSKSSLYGTQQQHTPQRNYIVDEIILSSPADAEALQLAMSERIKRYGSVSVGEVNNMLSQPTNPIDFDYGWKHLAGARVAQVHEGYKLVLPQIMYLK